MVSSPCSRASFGCGQEHLPSRFTAECEGECGWSDDEKVVVTSAGTDPIHKRLSLAQASVQAAESLCGKIRFVALDGRRINEPSPPS